MAYGKLQNKPATKFGEWLDVRMCERDIGGLAVANALHCSEAIISKHRSGKRRPTFSDVVAYCWLFGYPDDPETVWKLCDILIV